MLKINLIFLLVSLLNICSTLNGASLNKNDPPDLSLYVIMDTSFANVDEQMINQGIQIISGWVATFKGTNSLHFGMTRYPPHSSHIKSRSEQVVSLSSVNLANLEQINIALKHLMRTTDQVNNIENALDALQNTFDLLDRTDLTNKKAMCFWFSGDVILADKTFLKNLPLIRRATDKLISKCDLFIVNIGQNKELNGNHLRKLAHGIRVIDMSIDLNIDLIPIRSVWKIFTRQNENS
jgi:hypothetical protein